MTTLNPLAVQNAAVLRYLALPKEDRDSSVAEAARKLERDESNLRKTFKSLQAAGLIDATRHLTDEGQDQLEAIDRAETGAGEPATATTPADTGLIGLRHAQILPDPNNARRDWDSDDAVADLAALGADILTNGLLQNLVVRLTGEDDLQGQTREFENDPLPGYSTTRTLYRLLAGERRWRAIGALIAAGDWPADRAIPCRVVEADTVQQRLTALAENFQRRNLNPAEKAEAFEELAALYAESGVPADKINRTIADGVKTTIEHVQQHRSFMKLDETERARLALPKDDPKRLTVRDARAKVTQLTAREEAWKPADNPADQQLLLAELLHVAREISSYMGSAFPVGPEARTDPVAMALAEQNIIQIGAQAAEWGRWPGHYTASWAGWNLSDTCRRAWPAIVDDDAEKRHAALREVQQQLTGTLPVGDAIYLTAWLNAPFELDDSGREIVARAKAAEEERAARTAARDAEHAAIAARHAEARQRHLALLNAAAEAPPADMAVATAEAAQAIDHPLPWTLLDNGDVVDATGQEVGELSTYSPTDQETTFLQMVVVAMNSAAGLPTPPIKSAEAHEAEMQAVDAAAAAAEADDAKGED